MSRRRDDTEYTGKVKERERVSQGGMRGERVLERGTLPRVLPRVGRKEKWETALRRQDRL